MNSATASPGRPAATSCGDPVGELRRRIDVAVVVRERRLVDRQLRDREAAGGRLERQRAAGGHAVERGRAAGRRRSGRRCPRPRARPRTAPCRRCRRGPGGRSGTRVKRGARSAASSAVPGSIARCWNRPGTRMTGGPSPDRSNAIGVPSLDWILSTLGPPGVPAAKPFADIDCAGAPDSSAVKRAPETLTTARMRERLGPQHQAALALIFADRGSGRRWAAS